jgi:hypothetical protein
VQVGGGGGGVVVVVMQGVSISSQSPAGPVGAAHGQPEPQLSIVLCQPENGIDTKWQPPVHAGSGGMVVVVLQSQVVVVVDVVVVVVVVVQSVVGCTSPDVQFVNVHSPSSVPQKLG